MMENLEFRGTKEDWLMDATKKSIEKYPNYLPIVSSDGTLIALVNHTMGEINPHEYIANAKLINASKNILEALQGFVRDFEMDYVMEDGTIVDNPREILIKNYKIAKNEIEKALI